MKHDDDFLLRQISQIRFPDNIDIVDSVMSQIRTGQPRPSAWHRWGRYVVGAAACALIFVSVNILSTSNKDYNEPQLSNMLASLYSVDQYESQSIENYAEMDYWGYYSEEE